MKKNFIKIGLIFTTYFLVNQASQALAQASAVTNYSTIDWSQISSNELTAIIKNTDPSKIPANAWGIILKRVDWFQLPTNIQYYVSDNVDWSLIPTNIIEFYNQPAAWPNSRQALRHSADLMRSSIDTNWLAMIADKLTNQPVVFRFTNRLNDGTAPVVIVTNADIIAYFKDFSKRLTSTLDEYASYLTNPKLNAYLGVAGYSAQIPSPTKSEGTIYFGFLTDNGPTRDFRQIVNGESRARMQAYFYENGNLKLLNVIATYKYGVNFTENGQLKDVGWLLNNKLAIHINLDASGNPQISGEFLRKPSAQK